MKEKSFTNNAAKAHINQYQVEERKATIWTREKISQLIQLYKKHECLWNHWHEAYKSKDKRNRAIEDICVKLNIQKFEFGKKIHNLRNQFNTEMKKLEQRIEEAGVSIDDADDTELRCKWSHFESLMFLRNVIEPRPGGYQTTFQTPKKMRLQFELNNSEDEVNVTTVLPSSSGSSNTNIEDLSQFHFEDNTNEQEVITDDFHSFENDIQQSDQGKCSSEEICDHKYQPPQEQSSISARNTKSTKIIKPMQSQQNSSAQTDTNINESSAKELNANNVTVISKQSLISTASSTSLPMTTPAISSINTSSSSNRPSSILRDQWDAFGELVANEFRNLNSETSRKHLKRKIMQAMLEVGEEDDTLISSHS